MVGSDVDGRYAVVSDGGLLLVSKRMDGNISGSLLGFELVP